MKLILKRLDWIGTVANTRATMQMGEHARKTAIEPLRRRFYLFWQFEFESCRNQAKPGKRELQKPDAKHDRLDQYVLALASIIMQQLDRLQTNINWRFPNVNCMDKSIRAAITRTSLSVYIAHEFAGETAA